MKNIYLLFIATLVLVGCGQPKGNAYQAGTDHCTKEFVNAYNALVIKADESKQLEKNLSSDKETAKKQISTYIQQFKLKLIDFKSRYSGVNCKAKNTKDNSETYLDANKIADKYWDVLDNMEKALKDIG